LNNLNDLLNRSSSMGMFAETYRVIFDCHNNLCQLLLITAFCYLLGKVVSKRIIHDIQKVWDSVIKDNVDYFRVIIFNLFLKKSAATLILCK
jgi:hypothetical protein